MESQVGHLACLNSHPETGLTERRMLKECPLAFGERGSTLNFRFRGEKGTKNRNQRRRGKESLLTRRRLALKPTGEEGAGGRDEKKFR